MLIKDILIAVFVMAVWGFNFMFAKIGVHALPPLLLCAIRFFFAGIPIIFFIPFPKADFKRIIFYGLVMFGLQFGLVFTSLSVGMTAGMASILMQTQMFFSIILAMFIFRERPNIWQILGSLCAFSGIVIVAFHLDKTITSISFFLVIAGTLAWSVGNLCSKIVAKVDMVALIAWGSFIAFPPLLLCSFLIEGKESIYSHMMHFSSNAIISLIYIVYASTWLGYSLWNKLLRKYPVSTVVPFTLLIPIFGMLSSILFLHEELETWKILAGTLVVSGLIINLLMPKIMMRLKPKLTPSTLSE